MADLVSPIVDIISRLWPCCARHTSYLCKLEENEILLKTTMNELKEARDDVQRRVVVEEEEEADPTEHVRGWLERVHNIEGEVEVILKKADEQLSRATCLGGFCPPNNCWSNYKLGKSIAKKIPLVVELKGEGVFQVVCVARPTNYVSKLQDSKILLRSAMEELKNVKNDVQRKVEVEEADSLKQRTEQVRGWLQSVDNIEGEVEVIMQTSDGLLSNARCREKDKLVVMKKAYVNELKARKGQFEGLTYRLPLPRVEDRNRESPVGMESMFDKVWRFINNTDGKQPVSNIIGLYGQGGVGKTTLLEEINNEYKNKINSDEYGFDYVVIFVVVSEPVNYEAIQKKIGERLGLSLQGDGDEDSRAQKILNALKNKNYVLLLDDIWEDQSGDQFDKKRIGIPIHPQGNSKLIFTTRSKKVCGLMDAAHTFQVECLPWDKAWNLFQEKVGKQALNFLSGAHEFELAKDVARECDGLPLALITIGRAMSTKTSMKEWEDAKSTLQRYAFDFKEMRDKVLPRLKLSYDNLPNETQKSCFRYCALYPEDYYININKLIDLWIAEGILYGFDKLDDARNRGHTIIGSLKSACLLESIDARNGGDTIIGSLRSAFMLDSIEEDDHVKMHDVIRDLALWIVNDCRSSDESRSSNSDNKYLVAVNDPCKKWEKAERIFWDATHYTTTSSSNSNNEKEENPPTSLNLLTLIVKSRYDYTGPQSFFQHMPLLRVLDLSSTSLDTFPISICELHELQYLNLFGRWGSSKFPVELRKLVKLKFLILKNFGKIQAGQIANLSKLQVLDIQGDGLKDWELEDGASFSELDGLEQLQEVRITIRTNVAFDKFLCNRKLQMVCTRLAFNFGLSSSSSSSSTRVLDLSNFKTLKYLVLDRRFTRGGFSELEELVLNKGFSETLLLNCLPKLNNILWMGAQVPGHLLRSHSHSQSLHTIHIERCDAFKDLTWLVYVENLKDLSVKSCEGLETIIEFGGGDHGLEGVFGKLKTLKLCWLPNLKSICGQALAFPSIEHLRIRDCPELKKLPMGSGSNINNTLQAIAGEKEWWNELEWEDETIKSKFLPYFHKKDWL